MSKERMIIRLPFTGFYESLWSDMIDSEETQAIEYQPERDLENGVPENRRFTPKDEIWQCYSDNTAYSACYRAIAEAYVAAFADALDYECGIKIALEYESMTSPRFYNFETDRVFAHISRADVAKLVRIARSDKYETLRAVLKERHTSRSGFISFYSADLADWFEKPVSQWDHNELESLLIAAIRAEGSTEGDIERAVFDDWPDSGCHEYEAGVNWPAVEAALEALRVELKGPPQ